MIKVLPDFLNPVVNWPYFVGAIGFILLLWMMDQLFAPISTLPYGIVGFFGNRGRGKTFTAVTYARRWRKTHPKAPVFTNLAKLKVPGSGPVHLSCDMKMLMSARDALVFIDEAGVFINAWNFVAENQREFARWVAATRHMGCLVMMTAHVPEHINKRVRDVIDEYYFMESFQGFYLFRAKVFESFAGVKSAKPTKTVWIPKWWTTCNSYDTMSLRTETDRLGVSIAGPADERMLPFDPTHKPEPEPSSTVEIDKQTVTTLATALKKKRDQKREAAIARFAMPESESDSAHSHSDSTPTNPHSNHPDCAYPRIAAKYTAPIPAAPKQSHSQDELLEMLNTGTGG